MGRVTVRERLRGVDGPGRWPIGELLHPMVAVAFVVLILNDWWWKSSAWHGTWTGKVSDVAGLVLAPLALTASIGVMKKMLRLVGVPVPVALTRVRLISACIAVVGVFCAVKLSAAANASLVTLWRVIVPTAQIVVDPTDLWTLPAVAVAAWIGFDELRRGPLGTHDDAALQR